MCGIVGVASTGPMTVPMKEFFQALLFHDVVRGHHATGVAAIDTLDRSLVVEKKAIPSPLFLEDKEAMESLFAFKHNFNIYIGHNRWATSGSKTDDANAHPFVRGDIVGVHNGSLRNQRLLDDHKSFVVDSDNIMAQLNKTGLDDTIAKADGAYALVWYNKVDNSLNFIRNSERPLSIGQLSNGCWVWASEMGMLTWLVARHKTLAWATYKEDGKDFRRLYHLEEGQHMRFQFDDKSRTLTPPRLVKKTLPVFPSQRFTSAWESGYDYPDSYQSRRVVTTHSGPTAYQLKTENVLAKFIKGGTTNSVVEMRFVGIANEKSSTGYEAKIAIFEYQSISGMKVTLNAFCHNGNMCKDWGDDKIGATVYGQIGSVVEHGPAAYGACKNENLGHTIAVHALTETKPNKFYPYCDDAKVAEHQAKAQEGVTQNVIPFREQETTKTGSTGSEESPLEPISDIDAAAARIQALIDGQDKQSDKDRFMDMDVFLANGKMKRAEYIEAMTLNGARCCECAHPLGSVPTTRVYLYRHFDREDGQTHDYLACRLLCHRNTKEVCDKLDTDYTKLYGGIDD